MSTMIALLLVLSSLVGCAGETLTNVKNALPDPPAEAISFSVELERFEETVRGEDGAALAECSYELPVLTARLEDGSALESAASEDQERALAAVRTFNARFEQWKANPKTLAEAAREDQAFRNESGLDPVAYTDDLSCSVYLTESLVSVSGVYYTYTGGAHPNSILMSWNFDLESGTFFEPNILEEDGALKEAVAEELVRQAEETARKSGLAPEEFFWADYADILADWSSYAVSFDEAGMSVAFSPYELAAYAAGPQVFRLSYDQLRPYLGQHGRAILGLGDGGESAD